MFRWRVVYHPVYDGEQVAQVADGFAAMAWLLDHQRHSVPYACRYLGFKIMDGFGHELAEFASYRRC